MQPIIYGIKNCSTMKKTFASLSEHGITYEFFDYKKQSLEKSVLHHWIDEQGIDKILNKKGMTWRNLTNEEKNYAKQNADFAIDLMIEKPSLIKRPIIATKHDIIIGYDEQAIAQLK